MILFWRPLILAFLLAQLLVMQHSKLPFEYSRPAFANLLRLRNSGNKGHKKISGFTVARKELYYNYFFREVVKK